MAGLVPAISLGDALCPPKRDARHKVGHDGGKIQRRFFFFVGSACRCAISSAAFSSAALSFASVAVVQPCFPHAFGTGANASGAIMHLNSCSSGMNLKFAVLPSPASVT